MFRAHRRLAANHPIVLEADLPRPDGHGAVCPYLSAESAGLASQDAHCTHSGSAQPIHLAYQGVHCLSSRHERCPVLLGLSERP